MPLDQRNDPIKCMQTSQNVHTAISTNKKAMLSLGKLCDAAMIQCSLI